MSFMQIANVKDHVQVNMTSTNFQNFMFFEVSGLPVLNILTFLL